MSVLEILEVHTGRHFDDDGMRVCQCGHYIGHGNGVEKRHRAHVAEILDQHMAEQVAKMRQLVRDMIDPGDCWFDHRGGCQEHGYLDLNPGELCPHMEAKQLLGMEEPTNGR